MISGKPHPLHVMLLTDDRLHLFGLTHFLQDHMPTAVLTQVDEARQLPEALAKAMPDVLVLDLIVDGMLVFKQIEEIRKKHSAVGILVLAKHSKVVFAERCLRAGGNGFLNVHQQLAELPDAIKTVAAGGIHVCPKIQTRLLMGTTGSDSSFASKLTRREMDIFHLLGHGKTTKEIGRELDLSVKTIESYRDKVKEKLQYRTSFELVRHALEFAVLYADTAIPTGPPETGRS